MAFAQARLALVRETLEVTSKPMIYDGDTGGKPEIFRFTVRMLENLGVSIKKNGVIVLPLFLDGSDVAMP